MKARVRLLCALLLSMAAAPLAAAAECWDYDCPPPGERLADDGDASGAEDLDQSETALYCALVPYDEACADVGTEATQAAELDGSFQFSYGWGIMWAVIGAVTVAVCTAIVALRRKTLDGLRIRGGIGLVAGGLAVATLFMPALTVSGDFGEEMTASFVGLKMSWLGESDSASWYSSDAADVVGGATLTMARIALPLAALGILLILLGSLVFLTRGPGQALAIAGLVFLLGGFGMFEAAMVEGGGVPEGSSWSVGFWLLLAAILLAAASPLSQFLGNMSNPYAAVAAPALPAPASAAGWGQAMRTPTPVRLPAARCPKCGSHDMRQDGPAGGGRIPVQCSGCGLRGKIAG